MLVCYVCKKRIDDPTSLFSHIKDDHKIHFKEKKFQCAINNCWTKFSNFSSYKRHVVKCYENTPNEEDEGDLLDDESAELFTFSIEPNLLSFEKTLNAAVLNFACGLCSDMNAPRKRIFSIVDQLNSKYLSELVAGIVKVMSPCVFPEKQETFDYFVKVIGSSLQCVSSEAKLESALSDIGLIEPLTKIAVCKIDENKPKKPSKRKSRQTDSAVRRNRENYDEDVVTDNATRTRVKEYSHFNRIPCFHVTESFSVDLSHDLLEGSLHPSLSESIVHFIRENYFDLDCLNRRMQSIEYGDIEKGNMPSPITTKHLKRRKFKMSASEMFFFAHHLTFLIGQFVPDDDTVWQHVLTTINFLDLCYLPCYEPSDLIALRDVTDERNKGLKELFGRRLEHKAHLNTHYPELIEDFGPLRGLHTIRCEGKHKDVKNYAKNNNSRLNVSYSIGRKLQFQFASRLLRKEGLEDIIVVSKYTTGALEEKEYYTEMLPCEAKTNMSRLELFFTKKITVNGIVFSTDLWIPNFEDPTNPKIHEIVDVTLTDLSHIDNIFLVCKTYTNVIRQAHYASYCVTMDSLQEGIEVIKLTDYLTNHQYPVKIHHIDNEHLFRCKRF